MSPSSVFPPWVFYSISTISKEARLVIIISQFSRPSIENVHQENMCLLGFYIFYSGEILCLPCREQKSQQHLFLLMSVLDNFHIEQGFRVLETKSSKIIKVHCQYCLSLVLNEAQIYFNACNLIFFFLIKMKF